VGRVITPSVARCPRSLTRTLNAARQHASVEEVSSLADHLRRLPDSGLISLLRARPDLAVPVPTDIATLAQRAASRFSVARALDGLDRFTLEILDALRLLPQLGEPVNEAALLRLVADAASADAVRAALERLRSLAVVHGEESNLIVLPTVDEVCSAYPAGLGRPAAELDPQAGELAGDPARLRRTVLTAPAPARAILDRLAAGPPVGTVRNARRPTAPGDDDSPVRWLISRRLLIPISDDTVELPREVGLLLRRDTGPLGDLHPEPPTPDVPIRPTDTVNTAGAGQAMEVVRRTDALLDALATEPAAVLRSTGLGIRDLRRIARTTGISESEAGLLVEIAFAAELLDDSQEADPVWLPTPAYDLWREAPLAVRWVRLARAWLGMNRQPGLIGTRDDRDRLINALSDDVERGGVSQLRQSTLQMLALLPEGAVGAPQAVLEMLSWRAPRRGGRHRDTVVHQVLSEAATLGVTGLGALTCYGRALLAQDELRAQDEDAAFDPLGIRVDEETPVITDRAARALEPLLPTPVDHILVQADLTVVVPGPPEPSLAAELALMAEPESAGGATVYRITADSVRRALDAGVTAEDLHARMAHRSATPVPQALTYLIDDVARRHGGLRAGHCGCYLRSEDTALLDELIADRRLSHLELRRIAPTVVVTPYALHRLLDTLRDAGYAPVAEDASGATVLTKPQARRAPARSRPPRVPDTSMALDEVRLSTVVELIRQGDATARASRPNLDNQATPGQTLAVLQKALRERQRVWVGYVDSHGAMATRLVRPVSIGAGYLRAEDERSETMHTFALHRIASATLLTDSE